MLHSSLSTGLSLPSMAPPSSSYSSSSSSSTSSCSSDSLHERLLSHPLPQLDSLDLSAQLLHLQQQQQLLRHITHNSTTLTQQQPLQHTMSVADPFVPSSWGTLYSPPSPLDKLSPPGSLLPSAIPSRVDSFPPPSQRSPPQPPQPQLNAGQLLQHLTQLGLLHRLPAGSTGPMPSSPLQPQAHRLGGGEAGASSLMSPPPVQHLPQSAPLPQLNAQQLQLLAQLQQQQMTAQTSSSSSASQQSTPSPSLQSLQLQQQQQSPYSRPHPIQPKPISPIQSRQTLFPSPPSFSTLSSLPTAPLTSSPPSSTSTLSPLPTASTTTTMELGTVLLSYLSSSDLQRGLLYVNRLWRFRALHILQSRQVNVHIQLHHLYLGPFRPANMLELVFSTNTQVRQHTNTVAARQRTPEKTLAPLASTASPTAYKASAGLVSVSPRQSRPSPSLLAAITSPSSVARATVCAPLPISALVKAKEIAMGDGVSAQPAVVGTPTGRPLSKKKMREAALLAESKYNSIIECGILLPPSAPCSPLSSSSPPSSSLPLPPRRRVFKQFSPFFSKQVEVYTAVNDPHAQTLYRASALADKFDYATNKVGMYLSRRRLVGGGIYQATGFRCKPPGRTGLKCGGYFLTIEACKEFENHFQYGGLTEEQRKEKGMMKVEGGGGAGQGGRREEAADDSEGEEDGDKRMMKVDTDTPKGVPLSAVTAATSHSPSFSSSPSSTKKRHLEDGGRAAADEASGDSDGSPMHASFKRVKSDDGSGSDTTGRSTSDGSDGGGRASVVSVVSVGKRSERSGGSDEEAEGQSPTQSTRSSKSSASAGSVASSSSHRSAFKTPSAYRQASFTHSSPSSLSSSSPPLALSSTNDSISPPPSLPDLSNSPSTSPGTMGMASYLAAGAATMAAMYQSVPSSSTSSTSSSVSPPSSYPSMAFSSFPPPPPLFSPSPVLYGQSAQGQSASPPLAVSHQLNALTLGQPPVVPLGYGGGGGGGQGVGGLEAAFTSALMQQQRPQVAVGGGGEVSVGANGLLNISNLTLPQLQALLGVNGNGAQSLLTQLLLQQQQTQMHQQQTHQHQHAHMQQRYSGM